MQPFGVHRSGLRRSASKSKAAPPPDAHAIIASAAG